MIQVLNHPIKATIGVASQALSIMKCQIPVGFVKGDGNTDVGEAYGLVVAVVFDV